MAAGETIPRAMAPWAVRSLQSLRAALTEVPAADTKGVRMEDGWLERLDSSGGVRHVYDPDVAKGGWEFYQLRTGLSLLIVDMVTSRPIPRTHSFADQLVLSAVLKGGVEITDPTGAEGELANGYATVYGMDEGGKFETLYEPGRTLRWVSVVIDRDLFAEAIDLSPDDLPDEIRDFVLGESSLPYQNVPLSPAASLTALQVLECTLQKSFRRTFLVSKAIELACLILFSLKSGCNDQLDGVSFTDQDYAKLERAKRFIERSLDEPPNIAELAFAVGLTRQKLQLGFRRVFGDTVAQVRDKLRLEHALELVRNSALPMIQVALETGYEHPASFTRAFKAAYGVSPMQVRRMAQEAVMVARLKSGD